MSALLDLARPWAYVIVGIVAGAEGGLLLGLFLPGEATMIVGGVLVGRGRASLEWMLVAGCLGSVVGDSIGYAIGRRLGPRLQRSRLGRRVGAERWERANEYVRQRRGRAVFLGRFVGVLRALVPAIAGQAGIPYRTFLAYNAAGGVIWAAGFIVLGFVAGGSWHLVERWTGRASLLLLVLVLVGGAFAYGAHKLGRHRAEVRAWLQRFAEDDRIVRLRDRFQPQIEFVQRRLDPTQRFGLYMVAGSGLAVLAGWTFGVILDDVLDAEESVAVDRPVVRFLAEHREPLLNEIMKAITFLGSTAFVAVALIAAAVWSYRATRDTRLPTFAAGVLVGALGLAQVIKPLVDRPRPDLDPLVRPDGFAFPSGHATAAAACFAALAYLLARRRSWPAQVWIWSACAFIACLVALTRVYLGVHWPTDVVAGLALGSLWTAIVGAAVLGGSSE